MKERTKHQALVDHVINELHELKAHLCNSRPFEGGVGLGKLMGYLNNLIDEDETEDEDESEDEEEVEDDYCSRLFDEMMIRKDLEIKLSLIQNHLMSLIKKDHIYKPSIDECVKALIQSGVPEESLKKCHPGSTFGINIV